MARRVNQRWVARAVSLALLLLGAMIVGSGCTADTSGVVGESATGQSGQGLLCGCPLKTWCFESECGKTSCGSATGNCCVYDPDPRMVGERCTTADAAGTRYDGVCGADGRCCLGCLLRQGVDYVCGGPGTTVTECGGPGELCKNCDDGNPCTEDVCKEGRCFNDPLNGMACAGGAGICAGSVCCTGCVTETGQCVNSPNALNCGIGGKACARCEDNLPCTVNTCTAAGTCAFPAAPNNTSCANADVCDGDEKCQGGVCMPGTPLNCDDSNVCTMDTCNPVSGCQRTNVAGSCNDNDACTENDSCSNGACAGTPVTCNDQNSCTQNTCNPTQGCVFPPLGDNTPCDDGNECSTASVCQGGICTVTQGISCEDNRQCTRNDCDPNSQMCANTPLPATTPCNDNDACTQGDSCANGDCQPGTPLDCDDNNPCTDDRCDPAQGCLHAPGTGGDCNDLNPCTDGDRCSEGLCLPGQNKACPETECQEAGTCQTDTGLCDNVNKDDGTPCTGGECQGGVCMPVPPDGGAGAAGAAGNAGSGGSAGDGSGGAAGSSAGGSSGEGPGSGGANAGTGGAEEGDYFERDPGGCSVRTPASPAAGGHVAGLALAGLLLLGARSRRRRSAAQLR